MAPRVHVIKKARASKKVRKCETCGHEIQVGESYKYARQRTGYPYYFTRIRMWCSAHRPSRYTFIQNPKVAELMRAQDELDEALGDEFEPDDAQSALEAAADAIDDLAEQHRESAENIEMGFGHETEQSAEFAEKAEACERASEALREIDVENDTPEELPEYPDEPDEPEAPEEPEEEDYFDPKQYEAAKKEYEADMEHYEDAHDDYLDEYQQYEEDEEEYERIYTEWQEWRDKIRDEAQDAIGEAEA